MYVHICFRVFTIGFGELAATSWPYSVAYDDNKTKFMDSEDLQDTTTQHENMSIWPALWVARIH